VSRLSRIALAALLTLLLAACSNPLEDDGDEGSASSPASETATDSPRATLAPLAIVTPTPVDPRRIPGTPTEPPETGPVPETYIVQENDTLYSIAIRYQLNLADIVALNGLSDPNDIEVGQELRLPVPDQQ